MNKKLIAFDFDGTMVDTERLTVPDFIRFVEAEFGISIGYEEWMAHYNGKAGQSLLDELNAAYGKNLQWGPFIAKRNQRLPALFAQGLDPAPGLAPVLDLLWETKATFCICTNSQRPRNELALAHMRGLTEGLRQHLIGNCFSGVEDGRNSKPAPDVYIDAAKHFDVAPHDAVAIEDTVTGVTAGVAAGYTVIGYVGLSDHPDQAAEKLRLAGAVQVMRHWDEFLPLLATL